MPPLSANSGFKGYKPQLSQFPIIGGLGYIDISRWPSRPKVDYEASIVATVVTLGFVPVMYTLLFSIRAK